MVSAILETISGELFGPKLDGFVVNVHALKVKLHYAASESVFLRSVARDLHSRPDILCNLLIHVHTPESVLATSKDKSRILSWKTLCWGRWG
jgi:hypothetical protein